MSSPPSTIRVLHVDDEPDFTEMTATFLEREDERFSVETATSASEGLDYIAENQIDCIVSDYDMPSQDGIEFLKTVREEHLDLPFILFTGKGSEEVASTAISAGVTDYLQKESTTSQYTVLANRIRNAVEGSSAQRDRQRHLDAIETAQEGISILNDGQFIYVNEAYADLYGYEPAKMIGEHWDLIYPDENVAEVRDEILPVVENTGRWHGEITGASGRTGPHLSKRRPLQRPTVVNSSVPFGISLSAKNKRSVSNEQQPVSNSRSRGQTSESGTGTCVPTRSSSTTSGPRCSATR